MSTTLTKPETRGTRVWDPLRAAREEMETLWSQLIGEPAEKLFKGRHAALARHVGNGQHD